MIFIYSLSEGIKLSEKNECYQWMEQEEEFENFFWAEWQIEQCKSLIE